MLVSLRSNLPTLRVVAVGLSTAAAFVQFCGIVLYNVIIAVKGRWQCCNCDRENNQEEDINNFIDGYDRYPARAVKDYEARQPLLNSVHN